MRERQRVEILRDLLAAQGFLSIADLMAATGASAVHGGGVSTEQETGAPPGQVTPLLEVRGIEKSFPGVRALSGVSFDVRPGEVHALLGENGAGKSTLIKIVSGVYQPDLGSILVNGTQVHFSSPDDARRAGVATIYQELLLFPELSVAENIFLGHAPLAGAGRIDWRAMRDRGRAAARLARNRRSLARSNRRRR